ncbi:methionyl-tRNA synthetase [Candidatus Phytoplasma luffae]|uniref:Methionine--tRNA ligase n=1 Tax=Loofah witches'-broom phytoplasma TaxID=35773 RepID=A0A975ILV3_LOWBP|nr:methionine--tRNA ligase [Candidatus Phytoplasma luffae]QTX02812.1 methionyl-tRNA synthetase [Candidatus Phytoplasma luffae]
MNKLMDKKNFYIATSIVYASSVPHIGNVYEMILADVISRFKKLEGYNVYFQTGTDEHGQKIEKKALQQGLSTQKYVDKISLKIKNIYDKMNIKYDFFIRTSDSFHKDKVQKIIDILFKQKDIYLGVYEGWYSVYEESFISEKDLIDGKTINGETPVWTKEKVYFFKLSKYQDRLLKYLENDPELILPQSLKKEILNLLKTPLMDLCISRTSFQWGIYLNFDPKHIVYVWIDALSNYITSLGYPFLDDVNDKFKTFWPCDLHIIGKDISKFHLIYFPILLMALDLPLPKKFLIHPWILFNNKKMSKSLNNVLYTDDLLKIFPVDAIRYFVLHEIPYNSDGILTYELLFERYNTDLVNTIGNLLSRSIGMVAKYKEGELVKNINISNPFPDMDLVKESLNTFVSIKNCMKYYKIGDALEYILKLARYCNKYIDYTQPWNLYKIKENSDKLDFVLCQLFETIRYIGVLLQPFLPQIAEEILHQIKSESNTFESLECFGSNINEKLKLEKKLLERLNPKDFI